MGARLTGHLPPCFVPRLHAACALLNLEGQGCAWARPLQLPRNCPGFAANPLPLLLPRSLRAAGDPPAGRLAADADRQAGARGSKVILGAFRGWGRLKRRHSSRWSTPAPKHCLHPLPACATDAAAIYDPSAWPKEERPIPSPARCSQLQSMQFASGSMAPKVAAACRFVAATGGRAAVGSIDDALRIVRGEAGTVVVAG